jgi:hypothetical protein
LEKPKIGIIHQAFGFWALTNGKPPFPKSNNLNLMHKTLQRKALNKPIMDFDWQDDFTSPM